MGSSNSWETYYDNNSNTKPLIPESFIARCFLSKRPVKILDDYEFKNKKLLDVGCGDGRHIDFFEKLGFDTAGIEISKNKVYDLIGKFPQSKFKVGTSSDISFSDEYFDYLIAVNSIYYLNKNDTLKNNIMTCASKLKKGGVFIASFIGEKHFIVNSFDSNGVSVKYERHQCDDEIDIEIISSKINLQEIIESTSSLEVKMIGEIQDELENHNRHLYYLVAYKK